jgi:hypothetical protein
LSINQKLEQMSDSSLLAVWEGLRNYDPTEMYDVERGITMDEWAEAVYSEISLRGLKWQNVAKAPAIA